MFLASVLGSCSLSISVILNVCGVPAFLFNVDTTAAASAFSLAICIYLSNISSSLSIGSSVSSTASAAPVCAGSCSLSYFFAGVLPLSVVIFPVSFVIRSLSTAFAVWSVEFVGASCSSIVFCLGDPIWSVLSYCFL
jgi:hypothetical protein